LNQSGQLRGGDSNFAYAAKAGITNAVMMVIATRVRTFIFSSSSSRHNAIRKEIGYRLRAGLMGEPTNSPQYIQDLLDRLTNDTKGWTNRDDDTSH
jgi:hypothetical protein